jgi:uncharacterized membrane protein
MRRRLTGCAALLLSACGSGGDRASEPAALSSATPDAAAASPSAPPAPTEASPSASTAAISACLLQNGERIEVRPLHAVGTEPFWSARIEGRCVTWSTPERQQGVRVWTHYAVAPDGGVWSGALDGRGFELRARAEPGCSDGMSDRRYPIAVEVLVQGETRRGCAEPL